MHTKFRAAAVNHTGKNIILFHSMSRETGVAIAYVVSATCTWQHCRLAGFGEVVVTIIYSDRV